MAAAIINVDPLKKDDMFYRYKMPATLIKIEGNGNGIKTVFPNIREVCAKLQRPPEVLNKFFGYELGAQSTYIKGDDKFLVMGSFTQDRIQGLVYDFITRVVLCKKCRNPETDPRVEKKGSNERLLMTCRSCGADTEVQSTERILKFMVETYKDQAKQDAKKPKPKAAAAATDATGDESAAAADAAPADAAGSTKEASPTEVPDAAGKKVKAKIETTTEQLATGNPVTKLADMVRQVPPPPSDKVIQACLVLKAECNVSDANVIRFVWRGLLEAVDGSRFVSVLQHWIEVIRHFVSKDKQYETLIKEVAKTCDGYGKPEKFPMVMKMLWEEQVIPEDEIKKWMDTYVGGKEVKKELVVVLKAKTQPLMRWFAGEPVLVAA